MGSTFSEDNGGIAAVAEMLQRERPTPTFDELERVNQRLSVVRGLRPAQRQSARRGWSRLAMMACLSVGLLFTTAGSGLALSGYATSGSSVHAQYPDSTSGQTSTPTTATVPSKPNAHRQVNPGSLSRITPTSSSAGNSTTHYVSLVHAETDNELPFTGFAAIPVLLAGIALIAAGAVIHRRNSSAR